MACSILFIISCIAIQTVTIVANSIGLLSPGDTPLASPNLPRNGSNSNFEVRCDGATYGHDLNPESCSEVQRRIPTLTGNLRFGLRGRQGINVVTPWRWISSDGYCAIEVAETPQAQGSYLDLATAADEMNQVCVDFSVLPEGSIASNIGVDGKLSLIMRSYNPNVQCRAPILLGDQATSDEILRKMPATTGNLVFGRRGIPGVRVVLPLTYIAMDLTLRKKLVATVDLTRAFKETASWYDIYAAAVAITGMCVRDGKGGVSPFLGLNGKITVSIAEFAI